MCTCIINNSIKNSLICMLSTIQMMNVHKSEQLVMP